MRRTLRLRDYDYSSNGAYFVTICTHGRRSILTEDRRNVIEQELIQLERRFDGLRIDIAIVMPDHIHAILELIECPATLSAIVQAFKSLTTRRLNERESTGRVWQRGFYDRIVRDERELQAIREYIYHNPIVHQVRVGCEHPGAEQAPPLRLRPPEAAVAKLKDRTDT